MTSGFEFDELPELASQLHLSFRSGHISLEGQRMVLLHTGALGSLRKEMVDTLGLDRARGVLTRMGYASGQRDAKMVRQMMPSASDEDLMNLGPQLHSLEGIVDVKPIQFEIDVAAGTFHGEFAWDHAYEAEVHLEHFGMHNESVCWMQVGYASGYTSAVMRRPVVFREVDCQGKGDSRCRIIGRTVEEWGPEIKQELRYFQPDRVADQIVQLQNQVEHLRYSLDQEFTVGDMVGVSEAFRRTADMIRKAAESNVTVLLLGETGVGKEMFARALHEMSPRASSAFVAVNCAAMPEELIESELFGVEKGAFTGAQQSRPGRFERAHGGTLFLDEVGELSPAAQAKLLRVLQEGELERVGDTQTRRVDVRLVAATNVDLLQAVQDGRFRADLYYRLNIYPVLLPPLRERQEDVPLLVQRFLDKYNARHSKRITGVTERAITALKAYEWPGNIRELENMIERGVILVGNGDCIDIKDLFPAVTFSHRPPARSEPVPEGDRSAGASPVEAPAGDSMDAVVEDALASGASLDDLEKRLMEAAVERSDGNLTSAARMLGMTRAQLAYRLKKVT
ncbi:sigma-54-dependent Fis family transcriptional regulator [Mangrovitalea sediminis]|uniref:sigma-54-dependent Fis family transcriptional regulator n=1 Tax=Mangrovitalea sediminis TaxID=1982043 RepID=UPI000BE5998B|nr:sigma-54-dependent Fis family transcriptional regulator [Mangrovitalea sediminis]